MPPSVIVNDATLREGGQSAEVSFREQDRSGIANALAAAHIPRAQIGFASQVSRLTPLVKQLRPKGVETEALVLGFQPDWHEQVCGALDAGVDIVNVVCRASARHLASAGMTTVDLVRRIEDVVSTAVARGGRAVFQPSDGTRSDLSTLRAAFAAAAGAGVEAVYVTDTAGVATPTRTASLVLEAAAASKVTVGVHAHNDFGLAMANSVAAYEAGARIFDTCVVGLGDRCGIAATEELVMTLEVLFGESTGVRKDQLTALADEVARGAQIDIPSNKAVVGANAFAQKLEVHVEAALRDPMSVLPFDPSRVGGAASIVIGDGSGPVAIKAKLETLGVMLRDSDLKDVMAEVAATIESDGRFISDQQLMAMVAWVAEDNIRMGHQLDNNSEEK